MTDIAEGLLHGMVMQTTVKSFTGNYLYSDFATGRGEKNSTLNDLALTPIIGIAAGVARVALGIIHILGHLLAALITQKKGHLFHASKGACEVLRGIIEAIPIIGRIFAVIFTDPYPLDNGGYLLDEPSKRTWWMIKIYNPEMPDGLDVWMDSWVDFPSRFFVKE